MSNSAVRLKEQHIYLYGLIYTGKGSLDNGYLDDNEFSNKNEKNLKNRKKKLMDMFFYL
jgi:hypothetical protein